VFGVFDGHGGDHVAHYTAKHIQQHIVNQPMFKPPFTHEVLSTSFSAAILALDAELKNQPEHTSGHDQSGSTLTMVALTPTDVICANTGDSRSVLCRGGEAVEISNDHKPFLEDEKNRIENAGGHVKFNRVNGDLAVSRALGDFAYKTRDDLPATAQAVTADPEVIVQARTPEDQFLILACDGIWDVMSSQECVTYVSDLLKATERPASEAPVRAATGGDGASAGGPVDTPQPALRDWDIGAVCECLLDKCLEKGSRDNMSVVIVVLNEEFATGTEARRRVGSASTGVAVPVSPVSAPGAPSTEAPSAS